tara:strand:+ start:5653 stop:6030 length:378 start_codon:yes stop_codon:yes gene_type:complete
MICIKTHQAELETLSDYFYNISSRYISQGDINNARTWAQHSRLANSIHHGLPLLKSWSIEAFPGMIENIATLEGITSALVTIQHSMTPEGRTEWKRQNLLLKGLNDHLLDLQQAKHSSLNKTAHA